MEEKLLKYIDQNCQNEDFEKNTLDQISEKFQIGRNQCALLLKSLINQKKLTRIEEKPYKYLTTEYLHKKGKSMVETSYSSLETALRLLIRRKAYPCCYMEQPEQGKVILLN